ncbi:MAG: CHAP domain-containing protein [Leadbetterella sp.]
MKHKKLTYILVGVLFIGLLVFWNFNRSQSNSGIGKQVDSFNGVAVYYNGPVRNISGRNLTDDGYNLGMKYQCVEFVKRYYYQHLHHKMPDSYGNAVDFFDSNLSDGQINTKRNLVQYKNPSKTKPKVNDLLIYSGTSFNKYGHVSIVSKVFENKIEIIQQNPGPSGKSRTSFLIDNKSNKWEIKNTRILGWLRKE